MKKNTLTLLLVLVLVAAMLVGCGKKEETTPTTEFTIPPDITLPEDPVSLAELSTLQDCRFAVNPRLDQSGADVTVTITPVAQLENGQVFLSVTINGMEVVSQECAWEGSTYTATVTLDAADGYEYYCIFLTDDGQQERIALNTVEEPVDDLLVNLASSLRGYANLVVETWDVSGGKLSVSTGYAQVQLPRLFAGNSIALDSAALVLQINGEEETRESVKLPDGEGSGSYETALADLSFSIPTLNNDSQMDLLLEATLSDGTVVTALGASWFSLDGQLMMVAG